MDGERLKAKFFSVFSDASDFAVRELEFGKTKLYIAYFVGFSSRDYVNRYNLEKQFRQITAEQYSSGHARTKEMIETIGAVASVGASIAGIIVAYNKIKNG